MKIRGMSAEQLVQKTLEEAREVIVAVVGLDMPPAFSADVRAGRLDNSNFVRLVREGVLRGLELAAEADPNVAETRH